MRYPKSGCATAPVQSATLRYLLGSINTTGRSFFLRQAWFYNTAASSPAIMLSDHSATCTGPTAMTDVITTLRDDGLVWSTQTVSGPTVASHRRNPLIVNFPEPGLKFTTGCVVTCDLTTSGIYLAGGCGYEE